MNTIGVALLRGQLYPEDQRRDSASRHDMETLIEQ
jgi:hypothetical protein